ncbi:MAG TPA: hypothetical protein VF543_17620 [Pyrinomonadaceae bacterium]
MEFVRAEDARAQLPVPGNVDEEAFQSSFSSEDGTPEAGEGDDSLSDAAETERDYVRNRLRDESGREPSEEEVDEWLRRHTEGY